MKQGSKKTVSRPGHDSVKGPVHQHGAQSLETEGHPDDETHRPAYGSHHGHLKNLPQEAALPNPDAAPQ